MLAVALVALLVAVVAGTFAPAVARGVAAAGREVWRGIKDFFSLFHGHGPATPSERIAPHPRRLPSAPVASPAHHTLSVPSVVLEVAALVVAVALLVLFVRYVRPFGRSRRSPDEVTADVESDSIFSWRHLWSQLGRGLWGRLGRLGRLGRRRSGAGPGAGVGAPTAGGPRGPEDVRAAYRRMLRTARSVGLARWPAETTREYQARLAAGPGAPVTGALGELTTLYDGVRYGEEAVPELDRARAVECVDDLSEALTAPAPDPAGG
jgi:hypothetical protein